MSQSNDKQEYSIRECPRLDNVWDYIRIMGFTVTPENDEKSVASIAYGRLGVLCVMDTMGQIIHSKSFAKDYAALCHDVCRTLIWRYIVFQQSEILLRTRFMLDVPDSGDNAYDAWNTVDELLSDQVAMGIDATMALLGILDELYSAKESDDSEDADVPQEDAASPKPIHGFLSMPCLPLEKGSPFPIGICLTLAGEEEEPQDS